MNTDRIEKTMLLRAPRTRVWQAIAEADQFGSWFGMVLNGSFAPGACITGRITEPGYEHVPVEMVIEQVGPEHLFSYRWHPYAIEPGVDYTNEPMTRVEFRLAEVDSGTQVTLIESGFDRIPLERRATAFRMNQGGWTAQMENLRSYVDS
jgi:uncharacterized protein YndB with AHSA1/START domain